MSMQSEGEDTKGRDHFQTTPDGTASKHIAGTGSASNTGAMGGSAADKGSEQSASRNGDVLAGDTNKQGAGQPASQQGAMPPSQTDDDQYDQGTVQREP